MVEKLVSFDLEDPRAEAIAEALSNKTCKKILGLLSEKEMNASQLANSLDMPLNTIGYNLEKLIQTGLIEKTKGFFWSRKGKKIENYRIAHKKIVITPKGLGLSILPVIAITGIFSMILKWGLERFYSSKENSLGEIANEMSLKASSPESLPSSASETGAYKFMSDVATGGSDSIGNLLYQQLIDAGNSSLWFLLGSLVGILVFIVINRRKIF